MPKATSLIGRVVVRIGIIFAVFVSFWEYIGFFCLKGNDTWAMSHCSASSWFRLGSRRFNMYKIMVKHQSRSCLEKCSESHHGKSFHEKFQLLDTQSYSSYQLAYLCISSRFPNFEAQISPSVSFYIWKPYHVGNVGFCPTMPFVERCGDENSGRAFKKTLHE